MAGVGGGVVVIGTRLWTDSGLLDGDGDGCYGCYGWQ